MGKTLDYIKVTPFEQIFKLAPKCGNYIYLIAITNIFILELLHKQSKFTKRFNKVALVYTD